MAASFRAHTPPANRTSGNRRGACGNSRRLLVVVPQPFDGVGHRDATPGRDLICLLIIGLHHGTPPACPTRSTSESATGISHVHVFLVGYSCNIGFGLLPEPLSSV